MSGRYDLDVTCDAYVHVRPLHGPDVVGVATFVAPTRRECVRLARRAGWMIAEHAPGRVTLSGRGYALCPEHNPNRRPPGRRRKV